MRFVRKRDRYGRIRGGTYFVQEIANSPHPDLPDMAEPDTAEPYPVKPEALPTTDLNLKRTTTILLGRLFNTLGYKLRCELREWRKANGTI